MTTTIQSVKDQARTMWEALRLGLDYESGRVTLDEVRAAFTAPEAGADRYDEQLQEWARDDAPVLTHAS